MCRRASRAPTGTPLSAASASAASLTPGVTPAAPAAAPPARLFTWDAAAAEQRGPAEFLLALLTSQAADSKAAVRKGSVQVLSTFLLLLRAADAPAALLSDTLRRSTTMLAALACDGMLSVRKAVVDAAASLAAQEPENAEIAAVWATVVLPMMADSEATVQDAVQGEVRPARCTIERNDMITKHPYTLHQRCFGTDSDVVPNYPY